MAPALNTGSWRENTATATTTYDGVPRNIISIDNLQWDDCLLPNKYEIYGTHPDSRILFLDVNILDSTGAEPYRGDVLIEGKIETVRQLLAMYLLHR